MNTGERKRQFSWHVNFSSYSEFYPPIWKAQQQHFLKISNDNAETSLWTVWELPSTSCSSTCSRTNLSITRSVGYHKSLCHCIWFLEKCWKIKHQCFQFLSCRPFSLPTFVTQSHILWFLTARKQKIEWETNSAMSLDALYQSIVLYLFNPLMNIGLTFGKKLTISYQLAFHLPEWTLCAFGGWWSENHEWKCVRSCLELLRAAH